VAESTPGSIEPGPQDPAVPGAPPVEPRDAVPPPVTARPPVVPTKHNMTAVLQIRAFRYLLINSFAFMLVQSSIRFAFIWLVLTDLGGKESETGIVAFALGIPVLFLSLPAGVLSDRVDRRALLIWSQVSAAALTALLTVLMMANLMTLPLAYLLAVALGATTALGQPVRQAVVAQVVPRERLQNAVAFMTMSMNISFIIGPAVGGVLIRALGLTSAFAAQAAVYAVALLTLIPLRLPAVTRTIHQHPLRDLRDGLTFIARHRGILSLIVLLMGSGLLMIGPFQVLLPIIAKDKLGRDAFGASMFFVALGIGMFITSFVLASVKDIRNKGGWFTFNMVFGGLILALVGFSSSYALTMGLMFIWGIGGGVFMNLNQTLIQGNTPQELMGRVMAVHTLSFMGVGPLGSLVAGAAAGALGASTWMVISGAGIAVMALVALATTPTLRKMS